MPCNLRRRRRPSGFTLIEVMVAMSIAALGLAAVVASIVQMADAAISMQERTYANWIALNKISEMRLANVVPEVDSTSGQLEYAGGEWQWRATTSETGVENLFRVDVVVSRVGEDQSIRTVTGFIGEPGVPGQGNIAWTSRSPAVGSDQ